MPEPLTAVAASINASFKLADFCLSLQRAPEDITIFSQLVQRVGIDRTEAIQDFSDKETLLDAYPRKKDWVIGIIKDTNRVLERIGETVENARIDRVRGRSVTLQHRLEWVLSKKERVLTLQHWLGTCHQSLLAAISYMQSLQPLLAEKAEPVPTLRKDDTDDDETDRIFLRSPHSRRPRKSPSPLLELAPPTYTRTLSEDLERAFRAIEALTLNQEVVQQAPGRSNNSEPANESRIAEDILPNAAEEFGLATLTDDSRRSILDDRKRRRDAWLELGDT